MTIEELLKVLEMQEEILQFSHFTMGTPGNWAILLLWKPEAQYPCGFKDPPEQRTDGISVRL